MMITSACGIRDIVMLTLVCRSFATAVHPDMKRFIRMCSELCRRQPYLEWKLSASKLYTHKESHLGIYCGADVPFDLSCATFKNTLSVDDVKHWLFPTRFHFDETFQVSTLIVRQVAYSSKCNIDVGLKSNSGTKVHLEGRLWIKDIDSSDVRWDFMKQNKVKAIVSWDRMALIRPSIHSPLPLACSTS